MTYHRRPTDLDADAATVAEVFDHIAAHNLDPIDPYDLTEGDTTP